jgi:molybdopterin/thiamine biosynthesis adenylyltransferase
MIYDRYKDALWFGQPIDVILGGAGGIGSWVALLVARLQYRLTIYDFDVIEEHNVGTQLYTTQQARTHQKKVVAVAALCNNYGGDPTKVFVRDKKYDGMVSHVMISGFDNMEARKEFFAAWKDHVLKNPDPAKTTIFIDGRMSAEQGLIYYVKSKKDIEMYEKTLYSDEETEDEVCSYKATPHVGPLISSLMVSGLVNRAYNKSVGVDAREIPFETIFNIAEFRTTHLSTKEYYLQHYGSSNKGV